MPHWDLGGQPLMAPQLARLQAIKDKQYFIIPNLANYSEYYVPITIPELIATLTEALKDEGGIICSYLVKEAAENVVGGVEHNPVDICFCISSTNIPKILAGLAGFIHSKLEKEGITLPDANASKEAIQEDYLHKFRMWPITFRKYTTVGHQIDLGDLRLRFVFINRDNASNWRKLYFFQDAWYVSLDNPTIHYIHEENPAQAIQCLQNRRLLAKQLSLASFPAYYLVWRMTQGFEFLEGEGAKGLDEALNSFMGKHSAADITGLKAIFSKHQQNCYDAKTARPAVIKNWTPKNLQMPSGRVKGFDIETAALQKRYQTAFNKAWAEISGCSSPLKYDQCFKDPRPLVDALKEKYVSIWKQVQSPGIWARVCASYKFTLFINDISLRLFEFPPEARVDEFNKSIQEASGRKRKMQTAAQLKQTLDAAPKESHTLRKILDVTSSLESTNRIQHVFSRARFLPVERFTARQTTLKNTETAKMADYLNFISFLLKIPDKYQEARRDYCKTIASAWYSKEHKPPLLEEMSYLAKEHPEYTQDLMAIVHGLLIFGWAQNQERLGAFEFQFTENERTPRYFVRIDDVYIAVPGDPIQLAMAFLRSWRKLSAIFKDKEKGYNRFLDIPKGLPVQAPPLESSNMAFYLNAFAEAFSKPPVSTVLSKQFPGLSPILFYKALLNEFQNDFDCRGVTKCLAICLLQRFSDEAAKINDADLIELTRRLLDCLKNPNANLAEHIEQLLPIVIKVHDDKRHAELLKYSISTLVDKVVATPSLAALNTVNELLQTTGPKVFTPKEMANMVFDLLAKYHRLSLRPNAPQNLIATDLFLDSIGQWAQHKPELAAAHATVRIYVNEAMLAAVRPSEQPEDQRAMDSQMIFQHIQKKIRRMEGADPNIIASGLKLLVDHALANPSAENLVPAAELASKLIGTLPQSQAQTDQLYTIAIRLLAIPPKDANKQYDSLACQSAGLRLIVVLANLNPAWDQKAIQTIILNGIANLFQLNNTANIFKTFKLYLNSLTNLTSAQKTLQPLLKACSNYKLDNFKKKIAPTMRQIFEILFRIDKPWSALFFINPKLHKQKEELAWEIMQTLPVPQSVSDAEIMRRIWNIAKTCPQGQLDLATRLTRMQQSLTLLHALSRILQPNEYDAQAKAITAFIIQLIRSRSNSPTPDVDMDPVADTIIASLKALSASAAAPFALQITTALCQSDIYLGKTAASSAPEPVPQPPSPLQQLLAPPPQDPALCLNILTSLPAIWRAQPDGHPQIEHFINNFLASNFFEAASHDQRAAAFRCLVELGNKAYYTTAWNKIVSLSKLEEVQALSKENCQGGNSALISLVYKLYADTQFTRPVLFSYVLEGCARIADPELLVRIEKDLIMTNRIINLTLPKAETINAYRNFFKYVSNLAQKTNDPDTLRHYARVAFSVRTRISTFVSTLTATETWQINSFLILIYANEGGHSSIRDCKEMLRGLLKTAEQPITSTDIDILLTISEGLHKLDKTNCLDMIQNMLANLFIRLKKQSSTAAKGPIKLSKDAQLRISPLIQYLHGSVQRFNMNNKSILLKEMLVDLYDWTLTYMDEAETLKISTNVVKILDALYDSLKKRSLVKEAAFIAKLNEIQSFLPLCAAYLPNMGINILHRLHGRVFSFNGTEQWKNFAGILDLADQIGIFKGVPEHRITLENKLIRSLCEYKNANLSNLAFDRLLELQTLIDPKDHDQLCSLLKTSLLVHDRLLMSMLADPIFEIEYNSFLGFAAGFSNTLLTENTFLPVMNFTWKIFTRILVYPALTRNLGTQIIESCKTSENILNFFQDTNKLKALSRYCSVPYPPNHLKEPSLQTFFTALMHYQDKEDFISACEDARCDLIVRLYSNLEATIRRNMDPEKSINKHLIKKFRKDVNAMFIYLNEYMALHKCSKRSSKKDDSE